MVVVLKNLAASVAKNCKHVTSNITIDERRLCPFLPFRTSLFMLSSHLLVFLFAHS